MGLEKNTPPLSMARLTLLAGAGLRGGHGAFASCLGGSFASAATSRHSAASKTGPLLQT